MACRRGRRAWLVAAFWVLAAAAGCGGPPQAIARGRVTVDGEPMAQGTIAFLPAEGKGPSAGGMVTSGGYEVRGMTPGLKIVRVDVFAPISDSPTTSAEWGDQPASVRGKSPTAVNGPGPLPADAPGNNAQREVFAGEQVIDVAISRRGPT